MPETQKASIGFNGEAHLHDGTALKELVEVVSFGLPEEEVDDVETTHLKSPGRRKEYIPGLIDGGEIEVELNYRPGSDTDVLIRSALSTGNTRAAKFVVPENGVPKWSISCPVVVKGYSRGPVEAGDKMSATVTMRVAGASTEAAVA